MKRMKKPYPIKIVVDNFSTLIHEPRFSEIFVPWLLDINSV